MTSQSWGTVGPATWGNPSFNRLQCPVPQRPHEDTLRDAGTGKHRPAVSPLPLAGLLRNRHVHGVVRHTPARRVDRGRRRDLPEKPQGNHPRWRGRRGGRGDNRRSVQLGNVVAGHQPQQPSPGEVPRTMAGALGWLARADGIFEHWRYLADRPEGSPATSDLGQILPGSGKLVDDPPIDNRSSLEGQRPPTKPVPAVKLLGAICLRRRDTAGLDERV